MTGEIRLGFFVDGVGFHKDCSELLYRIDSSSDLKAFIEGAIIEIDEDLYKIQSVELGFIPYPGKKNFHREKPIKIVYVSKAVVQFMADKTKDSAIKVDKLKPAAIRGIAKEAVIIDDKTYMPDDFKKDFPHLVQKPNRRTKKDEPSAKQKETKRDTKQKKARKSKKEEPKKPDVKNKDKKVRANTPRRKPALTEGSVRGAIKTPTRKTKPNAPPPSPTPKKEKDSGKTKAKRTRRKRCSKCSKLLKDLGRHKCKAK